jgi:hypothetical protein
MKKTSAVAKATPKKVATKKVAQKKEKRSVGKIEINYINHGDYSDATMKVFGITRKEVLKCLSELAIRLAEDIIADNSSMVKIKKASTKKASTKKAVVKKTTPKKTK